LGTIGLRFVSVILDFVSEPEEAVKYGHMKVAIVEDHPMMREILNKVCSRLPWIKIVAEAASGADAVSAILLTKPEILLLDVGLPDFDGLEVLRRIRHSRVNLRTLIFSSYCNPYLVFRLLHSEIQGFVGKRTSTTATLQQALEALRTNSTFYSSTYLQVQSNLRKDPMSFDKILTDQQILVTCLLGDHCSDQTIANRLKITERTAETHRSAVMRKLGVHTRSEVEHYARLHGLISLCSNN
jgi:DNA-binding NarL/FixJ family response regulator